MEFAQIVAGSATALTLAFAVYQYNDTIKPMLRAQEAEAEAKAVAVKANRDMEATNRKLEQSYCTMANGVLVANQGILAGYVLNLAYFCTVRQTNPIPLTQATVKGTLVCMKRLHKFVNGSTRDRT